MLSVLPDIILLPVIFFIGIMTSYQDFRFGKIRNKWILFGLIWGMAAWLLFLGWSQLAPILSQIYQKQFDYVLPLYIAKTFANGFLSLIIGYVIWYFDLWSAGDAKLFFVFSLLLPLKYYWRSVFPIFPSLILLINIFTLALTFFALRSLIPLIKSSFAKISSHRGKGLEVFRSAKEYLGENYNIILKTAFIFFALLLVFQAVRYRINLGMGPASQEANKWYFLILFFLLSRASKYVKRILKNIWLVFLLSAMVVVYFWFDGTFDSWTELSVFLGIITKSLKFGLLFGLLYPLFTYANKKEGLIQIPFAVWIFMGTILTIFIKGSIISLISNWQNYWR